MKIDKRRPSHWLCLILFGLNVLGVLAWRSRRRRGPRLTVVLYGHKLSGNLLAIHRYWQAHASAHFDMVYLTMDKAYHRQLLDEGVRSVLATRPQCLRLLRHTDAIISDHNLHVMQLLVGRTDIKFFDVWHGFGFKGHRPGDFRVQHGYDEVWVASPLQRSFYLERFGFRPERVHATGYARMDRLVRQQDDVQAIRKHLDLAGAGRIILYAPTWKQDASGRSVIPFGQDADAFFSALSDVAQRTSSTVVVRAHLNTGLGVDASYPRIAFIPFASYPDTEAMLLASDVLVADWSSLVFDWLLLRRPTVFLDVEAPFALGFTVEPTCRYGELVADMDAMCATLESLVTRPEAFRAKHAQAMDAIHRKIFGDCADGHATERCFARLSAALQVQDPSVPHQQA